MRAWLREDVLRRVLKNTGLLGAGKAAGALLHLATLALTARWLGPAAFGLLILVRSYAQTASGLAKFQSWQTLIRFGAIRAERRDVAGFRDLAAFTILIDAASGFVALALALALAGMAGPAFGIASDAAWLTRLYCLAIPLLASATPTGILRIFDRFDHLALQNVLTPSVRLCGIALAALADAPLWAYVAAWLVSDLLGEAYLWLAAWREMKRRAFIGRARPSPRRALRDNDGILRFALASNIGATLNQALAPLFTLLVGGLLGSVSAGLYRIAQVVVDAVAAPAELAMRSLFPEVARLFERDRRHFWQIIGRVLVLASLLGLALAALVGAVGPVVLGAVMGGGYGALAPVLLILALGFVPILGAYPLETALLAMGLAGRLLAVRAIAAAASLGGIAILARRFGLPGAAAAATLGATIAFAGLVWLLRKERRKHG